MAKKVRILVDREIDGLQYKANQVVVLPDNLARSLIENNEVDASKEAVAYCEQDLGAKAIVHEDAAARAAKAAVAETAQALADATAAFEAEKDAATKAQLGKALDAAVEAAAEARKKAQGKA